MLASVTRLQPRLGSFIQGLAAFRAARLHACLSDLNGIDSTFASMLRARAFLRLGNPEKALAAAACVNVVYNRDCGELALLRAVAHSRLGEHEESESAFVDARVYGISSADAALQAEVEFYLGLVAFGEGSFEDARTACRRGLEIASAPPIFWGSIEGGFVPLAHVISRNQELLGVIDAADGRYRDQLVHARDALATLDNCGVADVYQEAFAVKNLAILCRDFDLDDSFAIVKRSDTLAWTEDTSHVQFATVEALGWCSALRGDTIGALRLFRRASNAATTVPEHVYISVARSVLSRELAHRAMAVEEIEHALELSTGYDWEDAAGDYRIALLSLAQAAAPIAPGRARETLDRYTALRRSMDSRFAARIESRTRAEEAFTHGIVLRAEGRIGASTERLQSAFETWEKIGYEWRAGRAALELAELNAGDVFRLAVHRELKRRPDSVFAPRARLVA